MNKDISVIIAAHKKYKMPEDGMYIPMQVGSQGKPDIGYIRDNTGDQNWWNNSQPTLTRDIF